MAYLLSCMPRRLPAALPAALAALQQQTAGLVLQCAAVVDAQLLQDRLRSNHTASCSHTDSHHSHKHQHGSSSRSPASSSFEEQEATCWSCHDRFHRGGLVCQACDKIQPSDPSLTHYDILG